MWVAPRPKQGEHKDYSDTIRLWLSGSFLQESILSIVAISVCNFIDLAHNLGSADPGLVRVLVRAWRERVRNLDAYVRVGSD